MKMNMIKIKIKHINNIVFVMSALLLSACSGSWFNLAAVTQSAEQTAQRDSRYQELIESADFVGFAEKYPNLANSFVLYNASIVSMQNNRIEDALFYYEAANARAAYDLETCLPTPKDAEKNLNDLFTKADQSLNVFAKSMDINKVLERYSKWRLLTQKGYDAGWQCRFKVLQEDKVKVADRIKKLKQGVLEKVAVLLNDEQYVFAAMNALNYLSLPPVNRSLILQNQYKQNKRLIIAKEAKAGTGLIGSKLP